MLAKGHSSAIRLPTPHDAEEFVRLVHGSRRLYRGLASPPATEQQFVALVERNAGESHFMVLITERASSAIVGSATLSQIILGNFRSAYLGYSGSLPYAGRGLMTEGIALFVQHAFRRISLHRIEANIQPGNMPSIGLVQSVGFKLEGFSPRYLRIAGRWRDHERWAITKEDWLGFAAWSRERRRQISRNAS